MSTMICLSGLCQLDEREEVMEGRRVHVGGCEK